MRARSISSTWLRAVLRRSLKYVARAMNVATITSLTRCSSWLLGIKAATRQNHRPRSGADLDPTRHEPLFGDEQVFAHACAAWATEVS
jgi:hypothetical protein